MYQWRYLEDVLERIGPDYGGFDAYFGASGFLPNGSIVLKWEQFDVPGRLIKISSHDSSWTEFDAPSSVASPRRKLESARIQSSDAARVQVWTVLPEKFVRPGRFIIDVHGGPHGVIFDSFNPEAHAWLDSGFGYCAVNYRGSIGFGKKFMEKIYGNPGHWEVEDIVAARNWLVDSGLADSRSVVISGWSWGGFVVLLALGKYPNLWAGGISGAGIADFLLQYEDEPAFFKAADDQRFGGAPNKVRKRYIRSSPITYAPGIQAPVCIIHGKNDARCPARQMHAFIKKMKRLNKKIETHWFSSGHAGEYANINLRITNIKKAISFAKKVALPQDRS